MSDNNNNDDRNKPEDRNLSGIQKYGRKIRERENEYVYTRSPSSAQKEPKENKPASGNTQRTPNRAVVSNNRSDKFRRKKKNQGEQHYATEKDKTWKDRRDSRFSTHGRPVIITIFVILFLGVVVFSALLSYTYLVDRTENPIYVDEIELDPETTVKFKIEKGWTTKQIVAKLEEMELVKNSFVYSILSKFNGYDSAYKSGVHYLSKGLTYDEIMTILSSDPLITKVTFPEGFTTVQMAERLEANNVCSGSEFLKAVNTIDVSSYGFLPKEKGDRDYILDGYLFPDTYEFEIDSSPETVIYKLLNRFNEIFKTEYTVRAEEKLGLTIDQVINIAAIVEKEALLNNEREIIAGVYYNRLRNEDFGYMQSDATVIYAYRRHGVIEQNITTEQRQFDDPYNTYMYPGLTPGPICNPSEASIMAVITMDEHDYYYYVAKSDGSGQHIFSRTLEEHKAAIASQTGGEETNND